VPCVIGAKSAASPRGGIDRAERKAGWEEEARENAQRSLDQPEPAAPVWRDIRRTPK